MSEGVIQQVPRMPDPPICIKVPQVIGESACQVVVVSTLKLSAPANEIKRVTKTVSITSWTIDNGKVLINGTLQKNVEYERSDNIVGSDMFTETFDCCLEVPGALSTDEFQLEVGEVLVEQDDLQPPLPSTSLLNKACVHIIGKVTRTVQISVTPVTPSVCPPVPTTDPS